MLDLTAPGATIITSMPKARSSNLHIKVDRVEVTRVASSYVECPLNGKSFAMHQTLMGLKVHLKSHGITKSGILYALEVMIYKIYLTLLILTDLRCNTHKSSVAKTILNHSLLHGYN